MNASGRYWLAKYKKKEKVSGVTSVELKVFYSLQDESTHSFYPSDGSCIPNPGQT